MKKILPITIISLSLDQFVKILVIIYLYFIRNKKLNKLENISYGLLLGGIIGNLLDKIIYGYVIDYLDFKIINYGFPIFNIADICIVISIVLIGISLIVGEVDEIIY